MADYLDDPRRSGGLLNNFLTPARMGLLGASAGLLQAGGPSRMPISTGQALSQGLLGGLQGYMQGQSWQDASEMKAAQLAKMKRDAEEATRNRQVQDWALSQLGFGPESVATPAPAPQVGLSPSSAAAVNASWATAPTGPNPDASTSSYAFSDAGDSVPPYLAAKRRNAPGAGSPFAGVHPNAILMTVAGQPQIGKMIHDATKPTGKIREALALGYQPGTPAFLNYVGTQFNQGGAWQVGPDGRLQLAPGYAQGMGEVKGAEEGARAAYDLVTVPMPGGGTQLLPRSVAAARLGGGQGTSPTLPALPPVPQVGNTQPGAQNQGGGMGYTRPSAQTGADTRFAETLASEFAKNYADLQRADFNAPANISKYQQLGNLLARVKTGKFTATTTQIKAAAKSAGIDLGALGIADDVAPAQAALALSNQLALELRNPAGGAGMPGALSDKDREFLVSMVPGLENDPASIPLMIEYRVKLAQRERDVAKMARAYKKRHGRFDDGFYDELATWSEKNPLFTEADRRKAPNGGFRVLGVEAR